MSATDWHKLMKYSWRAILPFGLAPYCSNFSKTPYDLSEAARWAARPKGGKCSVCSPMVLMPLILGSAPALRSSSIITQSPFSTAQNKGMYFISNVTPFGGFKPTFWDNSFDTPSTSPASIREINLITCKQKLRFKLLWLNSVWNFIPAALINLRPSPWSFCLV